MKYTSSKQGLTLEDIEKTIKETFPDLKLSYRKVLIEGRYLVVEKTKWVGLGIFLKPDNKIVTREIIPSPVSAGIMAGFGLLGILVVKALNRKSLNELNSDIENHIKSTY